MRFFLIVSLFVSSLAFAKPGNPRPRLVLVIVFDQFRADALTRFSSRFLPPKLKSGGVGGFRYLMENGAYYPHAQHGVLHNMTCPGHAAILTGAYPYQHGIPVNDWVDPETGKHLYCVEDPLIETVGSLPKDPHPGTSPKNLVGSTFGDELKNAGFNSKVVTVSLKDRAAILLGGHRADLALWFDIDNFKWVSSKFYLPSGKLPDWVEKLNRKVESEKKRPLVWKAEGPGCGHSAEKSSFPHSSSVGDSDCLYSPYGVEKTVEAAELALTENKLGKDLDTDVLAVSYSTHDFIGHVYGPNSRETEEITVAEDQSVSRLLNYVNKNVPGGLNSTLVVLTADHGVAPNPEWLQAARIPSGRVNEEDLLKDINDFLDKKFRAPKNGKWVAEVNDLNFYLNAAAISEGKLDKIKVENAIANFILESKKWSPSVAHVFTSNDVKNRTLPGGMHETQILRTFYRGRSGDVDVILKPFYTIGKHAATHFSGYSYDRAVPIILAGPSIKSGTYAKPAQVIDIAPTLSFLSGIIPPSGAEGRVLDEAIK